MEYEAIRREIALCSLRLYGAGLMTPLGGNISVRLPGVPLFLATPTRIHKATLRPEDMVLVDGQGSSQGGTPSIEIGLHLAVYRSSSHINAIIHTHSPMTVAASSFSLPLEPCTIRGASLMPVPELPPLEPGSDELAQRAAAEAQKAKAIILQCHGALAFGRDLTEAEDAIVSLEDTARLSLLAHILKRKPRLIWEGEASSG